MLLVPGWSYLEGVIWYNAKGIWRHLSQGLSAKSHVLKRLQGVKQLGQAVQKIPADLLQCSPRPILLFSLEFPSFCKAQPVAWKFTVCAENAIHCPSTPRCSCAVLWDSSSFCTSANLHSAITAATAISRLSIPEAEGLNVL